MRATATRAASSRVAALAVMAVAAGVVAVPLGSFGPIGPSASASGDSGVSGDSGGSGGLEFPVVDEVPSVGAELIAMVRADDPTPDGDEPVVWTITVANRDVAAAAATAPDVWLGAGDGIRIDDVVAAPEGWSSWIDTDGRSASFGSDESLEPGTEVTFEVRSSILPGAAPADTVVWASPDAEGQWEATPRAGRSAEGRVVVGGVELSGTVVADASGSPLGQVCVDGRDVAGGDGWWSTSTWVDGTWTLPVPIDRTVDVRFDPSCQVVDGSGTVTAYATRWWPASDSPADAAELDTGASRSLGSTSLRPGGAVAGTVTVPADADPTDIDVSVEDASSGWWLASGSPAADGTYLVHGLPAGTRLVAARDRTGALATQYHAGAARRADATPVALVGGQVVVGVDASLESAATITGYVTGAVTGDPVAGADVQVLDPHGEWIDSTTTGSDGAYHVGGLAAGPVVLRYEAPGFVPVFHDGSWQPADVVPVVLEGGGTVEVAATLEQGVSVHGRVTAATDAHDTATGAPIADVAVLAWAGPFDGGGDPVSIGITGPDGAYSLAGLPPTEVSLAFVHGLELDGPDGGIDADWAVRFWPGVDAPTEAGTLDLAAAAGTGTSGTGTSGTGTSGTGTSEVHDVDAALHPAPTVRGRVLDARGGTLAEATGLADVGVVLVVEFDDEPFAATTTSDDGSFELAVPFAGFDVFLAAADLADVHDGAYPPIWHGGSRVEQDGPEGLDPVGDGAVALRLAAGSSLDGAHLVHDAPPPPAGSTTGSTGPVDGGIEVSWAPVAGPVDRYEIHVDGVVVAAVGVDGEPHAARTASPVLRHLLTDLEPGRDHEIDVVAVNLGGSAAVASFTVVGPGTDPHVPARDPAPTGPSAPAVAPVEGVLPIEGPESADPVAGEGSAPADPVAPVGELPHVGAESMGSLLLLAAALIVVGVPVAVAGHLRRPARSRRMTQLH